MSKAMAPDRRRRQILRAAVNQAKIKGFDTLTPAAVGKRAGVTHGLVIHYFKTMKNLREAVMAEAVEQEILKIVAYGLALNYIKGKELDSGLLEDVIEFMTQGE